MCGNNALWIAKKVLDNLEVSEILLAQGQTPIIQKIYSNMTT